MTRKDLIKQVSVSENITQKLATAVVTTIFTSIALALKADDTVAIADFGTFKPAVRKGKSGINPLNKKPYTSQDKKVVKFKASSSLGL